jgi:hypothetical protein
MKVKVCVFAFLSLRVWCSNTAVLFQPSSQSVGPFPTNALTVAAPNQKTGLEVNLPLPAGCTPASMSSDCFNVELLNQLDGFSVNPRITVCFSGPVNVSSLAAGIIFVPVSRFGLPVGINQIIVDPVGNCAYAKPNQVLNQDTTYLLLITSAVTDSSGKQLKASADFSDCVKKPTSSYCQQLSQAIRMTGIVGNPGNDLGDMVGASLFTTLSATSWVQQARSAVNSIQGVGSLAAPPATFALSNLASMVWMPDLGVPGDTANQPIPLADLTGVAQVSFGAFISPLYLNTSGPLAGSITTTPTNQAISAPSALIPVSYHVFLPPASAVRGSKIPVIIFGHGLSDSQFGAPSYAASTWAKKGYATLAFEITGHGYGPGGVTQLTPSAGAPINIPTPGRGIQFNPAQPIGPEDGCILPGALGTRDCLRQSAVDLFALVRAISTTGLGVNLDSSRIYYVGQSFGAFYGAVFEAVEPKVSAGTLNGSGSQIDVARLSIVGRQLGAAYLAGFSPPLLNVPPASSQAYFHDGFNDEYVYRGQAITASVPGALAIQAAFEQAEWLSMLGDTLSFAPHLWGQPLSGVPPKLILDQFGLGDLEVPNPTESAAVRAGALQLGTWMLRTDLTAGIEPQLLGLMVPGFPLPIYPHRFLANPTFFLANSPALEDAIGVAAQSQIADFYTYGWIPNPNQYFTGQFSGLSLFQIPILLPDQLDFLQIAP